MVPRHPVPKQSTNTTKFAFTHLQESHFISLFFSVCVYIYPITGIHTIEPSSFTHFPELRHLELAINQLDDGTSIIDKISNNYGTLKYLMLGVSSILYRLSLMMHIYKIEKFLH